MANTMVNKTKHDSGFTLIELMIVVLILSVLSTIAVISVVSAMNSSKIAGCKSDFRSVESAISAFKSDNLSGWVTSNELYWYTPGTSAPSSTPSAPAGSLSANGYLSLLTQPDTTSSSYYYLKLTGGRDDFQIQVFNQSGQVGSSNDVNACSAL